MNNMITLVIEHTVTIEPFVDGVVSKFPASSIIMYKGQTADKLKTILANRPMFTEQYILYFDRPPKEDIILMLKNYDHRYIIRINMGDFEEYMLSLKKVGMLDITVVDNWNLDKQEVHKYISNSLKIEDDAIDYLWRRTGEYLPRLIESVSILKSFDVVDRKVIQMYVPRRSTLGYRDLLQHLLGVKKRSDKQVFELLAYYSKGHKHIASYLVTELSKWRDVWNDMDDYSLTPMNAKEYWESEPKNFSRKELLFMTSLYSKITTEYIEILLLSFRTLEEDFKESEFIKLLLMYN